MSIQGRLYKMAFNNVTLSAAQDALAIYAGSTKKFGIRRVTLDAINSAVTSSTSLRVRIRYLPATVTSGSAGSAGTINPIVIGDAAATVTGRINDTTQATTGSTAVDYHDGAWNLLNGFDWTPPDPSRSYMVDLSGACIISIDSTPSSVAASGTILIEEI